MRHLRTLLLAALMIGLLVSIGPATVFSIEDYPLENCSGGCFSTEEDFVMQKSEPYDGNPYISDGDLLSLDGKVCARNADLLQAFYVGARPPVDLGLDAVDVLDIPKRLVAFSTELDDPNGAFTAGDLLFTNGGVIPNQALVAPFGIRYDIGLDALQFVGDPEAIAGFAGLVLELGPDGWEQGKLQDELERYNIDLWFSIEGTYAPQEGPSILDGDLLSALGTVVVRQASLLPPDVPAGIPSRGVDFGLDAVASPAMVTRRPPIYFSTEILYRGETSFTDGDVLSMGNGVITPNESLIKPFAPAADFLGLDALDIGGGDEVAEPRITHIGQVSVDDIDGGKVAVGGSGTGLANTFSYDRPYGGWIPIYGDIPAGIDEFRVVYRLAGTARPVDPATAPGIAVLPATNWRASDWNWFSSDCSGWTAHFSDAGGWYDAAEFRRLRQGEGMPFSTVCNAQLALTVWNSADGATVNTEGHYVVWLQWRTGAGPIQEEPFDHHVQFDNKAPENLELVIPGGACSTYGPSAMPIMVQGHVDDPHFWRYRLRIFGGNPPAGHYYPIVNYDDDPAPGALNVGPTGTGPGNVNLHEVNVSALPAGSVTECCYGVRLWVEDRTIVGSFSPPTNLLPWGFGFEADKEVTFAYAP